MVVITGASSGIGLVTAQMAARRGARLVLAARNEDALRQLANEIRAQGSRALAVPTDVGDVAPRFMDKVMEALTVPGQVDPKRPARNPETSALPHAGYGLHERGSPEGWFRDGSIYVKVQEHPLLAATAVAGVGLGAWALGRVNGNGRSQSQPQEVAPTEVAQ